MFTHRSTALLDRVSSAKTHGNFLTLKQNEWLEPTTIKQVPFLKLENINFTSAECSLKLYREQMRLKSDNQLTN